MSQGDIDLTNQLRTVVPSFNVNTQPISDAATIVRPANLRNMAPDHTLILVNGKRRHRAAVIAWLGNGIADGAQGPDLSVIPSIALRQVEVLRDGAAAQYGSDAIAGVMNFELKNNRSGGNLEYRTGRFSDENAGDPSTCGPGRSCNGIGGHAQGYTVAGNIGLPLGPEGFVNLSLEYGATKPTNRAVQDNGALALIAGGNTSIRDTVRVWGTPKIDDELKLFGNFGTEFANNVEFYGHTQLRQQEGDRRLLFPEPEQPRQCVLDRRRRHAACRRRACRAGTGIGELPDGRHYQWHTGSGCLRPGHKRSELLHISPAVRRCDERFPGRLHAAVRRRRSGRVARRRRARDHGGRSLLGRQRQHGPESGRHLHLRHGQRVARTGQPDQLQAEPVAADRHKLQHGPLVRRQRHD